MTEAEWLTSDDAGKMLAALPTRSHRKCRLFACICCERIAHLLTEVGRHALEVAERVAEGQASQDDLVEYRPKAPNWVWEYGRTSDAGTAVSFATQFREPPVAGYLHAYMYAAQATNDIPAEWRFQSALLRCIIGNPFRPVAFDPRWRSETAVALASAIYAERAFDRLPILADALEEAGCDHADLLAHCRGPGPHARGCWVVDLVLNKS